MAGAPSPAHGWTPACRTHTAALPPASAASSQAFQQEEPAALLTTPILPESHPEQLSVDCLPSSSPIGGTTVGDGVAMPPAPRVVQRRASITPRAGDAASTAPYIFG